MLPPDSPELNPVGRLWDVSEDRTCNQAWEDLDALIAPINEVLSEYWANPSLAQSLVGEGWLLDPANASSASILAV